MAFIVDQVIVISRAISGEDLLEIDLSPDIMDVRDLKQRFSNFLADGRYSLDSDVVDFEQIVFMYDGVILSDSDPLPENNGDVLELKLIIQVGDSSTGHLFVSICGF